MARAPRSCRTAFRIRPPPYREDRSATFAAVQILNPTNPLPIAYASRALPRSTVGRFRALGCMHGHRIAAMHRVIRAVLAGLDEIMRRLKKSFLQSSVEVWPGFFIHSYTLARAFRCTPLRSRAECSVR